MGLEIRNSVLMGLRRKRITQDHAKAFLEMVESLPVQLTDPVSYDDIFALADRYGLTVYDAAYLDLAIRENLPIASLDAALLRAGTQCGIPTFQP
jgi:predicted nucleic acid-binding protein